MDYFTYISCALRPHRRRLAVALVAALGIIVVDLGLEVGMESVWESIETLTNRLCDGLTEKGYHISSPRREGERSGIVVFEPPAGGPPPGRIVKDLEERGVRMHSSCFRQEPENL